MNDGNVKTHIAVVVMICLLVMKKSHIAHGRGGSAAVTSAVVRWLIIGCN